MTFFGTYMESQIQGIAGVELPFEGQCKLVHLEDLTVLLIVPAHPAPVRTGVGVSNGVEESILILEKANIRIGEPAALRESQIEPSVLLIESVLQME